MIDLTLDSSDEEDDVKGGSDTPVTITPGPSHTSDASNSSGGMSPAVINLDAPSPAHSVSTGGSPAPLVMNPAISRSTRSPYASPGPVPTSAPILNNPPPAHAYQPPHPPIAHRNPPSTFSNFVTNGPPPPPLMVNGPQGLGAMPPINLEQLSEAEFEEFLHGLQWGV